MSSEPSNNQASKSWLERISNALNGGEPRNRTELISILRDSHTRQLLDTEALNIIEGALQVSDMQVREVMIPKSQMIMLKTNSEADDLIARIVESGHSRFPVIDDDPDEVIGILLAKDLLPLAVSGKLHRVNIKDLLRPAKVIPESKHLNTLLKEFRATRNHMAVVANEYGSISGLITIEDVLEQIVGEIEDEHDIDEGEHAIKSSEGCFIVKARTPVDEFNSHFKTGLSVDDYDTIGGFVLEKFGRLPKRNEMVEFSNLQFKVLNADSRSIRLLQVTPTLESRAI
ncbi:MAG: magnesium/cobalt efflux protein [Gammaproteobacteria bacterium]|nr:MAG: magnesium/cobalt efflux protein [Gammaproteobacteria bacterium]